jgi:hypothetical protein
LGKNITNTQRGMKKCVINNPKIWQPPIAKLVPIGSAAGKRNGRICDFRYRRESVYNKISVETALQG